MSNANPIQNFDSPGFVPTVENMAYQSPAVISLPVAPTPTGNPDPVYNPAFDTANEGKAYIDNPSQGSYQPGYSPGSALKNRGTAYQTPTNTGISLPVPTIGIPSARGTAYKTPGFVDSPQNLGELTYLNMSKQAGTNPGSAISNTGTHYGVSAQTTDSQVTSPVIVFQVNLETVQRYSWEQPNRTYLEGNETVDEADNMKYTRTLWIQDMINNGDGTTGGSVAVAGIDGIVNNSGINQPYLRHGSQFTVKGQKALYLKNLWVSSPPSPNDLLIVVSQS